MVQYSIKKKMKKCTDTIYYRTHVLATVTEKENKLADELTMADCRCRSPDSPPPRGGFPDSVGSGKFE